MAPTILEQPPVLRTTKPKRSLNVYNIFFQMERQRLLAQLPARKKTNESRGHGKIGFYDLARTISANWKKITMEQKDECLRIVALDRKRFEKEMEEFKATSAWLESMRALETTHSQATLTMTTPSTPKMSSQVSVVSVDYSEDLKCREIQYALESVWEPLPVTTRNQGTLACTAAIEIELEPNINIDWDSPATIAELSQRLDEDSQDILIRALL